MGTIHAASLKSERLQRLWGLLETDEEYTTRDIIQKTGICAVNTAVSELRANLAPYGIVINCRCISHGVYAYSLGVA